MSHTVDPSAANRASDDTISTAWLSRGGDASEIPNRCNAARTTSGSLVTS